MNSLLSPEVERLKEVKSKPSKGLAMRPVRLRKQW
jgi:hypothetical protein